MSKVIELTGQKFNRLRVLHRGTNTNQGQTRWACRCDCGNVTEVISSKLRSGHTKSCGCLEREILIKRNTTHGKSDIPEYRIWAHIKYRCYDKNCASYPHYGGRGITVCDRWLSSFEHFLEDMGTRPKDMRSIERVDNDGNYEPDNCIWSEPKAQANNKSSNRRITYRGVTQTLKQWSESKNIGYGTLHSRLGKLGWDVERSLTEKPDPYKRKSAYG